MNENKKLWDSVLVDMELTVSKANFNTWFRSTYIMRQEDGTVYISVPNAFVRDWLLNKFHKNILKSLRTYVETTRAVEYIVTKDDSKRREAEAAEAKKSADGSLNATAELPLQENLINKDDNLNPKYNFESFVIGPFNELAYAASQAIIKNPGRVYNPLFIYGNTGLGKTHLIQAVGNHIKNAFPGKKVFYVTSEKFVLDYVNSIQQNKMTLFKEKYRKYDVFIMDDIQFLANKEKGQEELFHLFNSYYEANKQIIFSSDRHPNYIPNLEDRLKSRFGSGMIIDVPAPDLESRVAILISKAKQSGFTLTADIAEHIASTIQGSIRELEGALNTVVCQTKLKGRDLSILEVKNTIKNNSKPKKIFSVKDIIKTVADFYNIDENAIYDKTRRKEVVRPRQVVMYILREDCNVSYPSIGQKLGGRDHTTVIHSCEKIKGELKQDTLLNEELDQIRAMI